MNKLFCLCLFTAAVLSVNVDASTTLTSAAPMLATLGDINGDGTEDIAVLVHDADANLVTAVVKDAEDGQLINQLSFDGGRTPFALRVMPDIDNNGAAELVVLSQGSVKAEIRDSLTGSLQSTTNFFTGNSTQPIDLVVVPDQNGNGIPDLAVLGSPPNLSSVHVIVKDPLINVGRRNTTGFAYVAFNPAFIGRELKLVTGLESEGALQFAVLGVDGDEAGELDKIGIRNIGNQDGGKKALNNVFYNGAVQATRLAVLPDQNANGASELAVLRQGRYVEVRVNDARTDELLASLGYNPNYVPQQVLAVPDVDGNGSIELGVLGKNQTTGQIRIQVKDLMTNVTTSNVYFGVNFLPQDDADVISDISGNARAELVYLGQRASDGKLRVFIRDSLTGQLINAIDF